MRDSINGYLLMRPAFSPARHTPAFALILAGLFALVSSFVAPSVQAQSPFSAAFYVNDHAVTNYEITQKIRFLEFIGASSTDLRETAIERLIEDQLQMQEAVRLGGRLTPDQVDDGMAEFASRAELTTEEFGARLREAGVDRETFETFIRAGVLWREMVQVIYRSQINITDAMIDQALSVEGIQPVTEVLISEIFLPSDPQYSEAVQRVIPQIQRIRSEAEFANAARQVSAAPTATSGGRVDRWVGIGAMPPEVGGVMETAGIGTVVGPIEVPGAYAFFQLRARRNSRSVPASAVELAYHRTGLAGGRSEGNLAVVQHLQDQVDSCVDFPATMLRAVPQLSNDAVGEIVSAQTDIDANIRAELERLNPGQVSANLVQNGDLIVLMLCRRTVAAEGVPPREEVRMALLNRALEAHGMAYLQRLRADADIRYP